MAERMQSTATLGHPGRPGEAAVDRHKHQPRMTLGLYVRTYWADYLMMAAMGAVGLGVYEAPPAPSRLFPIYFADGEIVNPEVAYPYRSNIIPIWLAALLAFIIPFVFFVICQIRVRSFYDLNAATMGLLFSLITAAVFQVFIKWLIGGLRPHFLAACQPNVTAAQVASGTGGSGFGSIMFDRTVCTGDEKQINDSLESMPSGHSTAAFAGFVYLSLYLNAKLKIFSNYRPRFYKLVLFYAPILGACLIAGSLTIDKYHHWYDVMAGGTIGTLVAFGAYRFQYASVWDFRFNHIPLPSREGHFAYTLHQDANGPVVVPATRQGDWHNLASHYNQGAPFDAAGRADNLPSAGYPDMHQTQPVDQSGRYTQPMHGDTIV